MKRVRFGVRVIGLELGVGLGLGLGLELGVGLGLGLGLELGVGLGLGLGLELGIGLAALFINVQHSLLSTQHNL